LELFLKRFRYVARKKEAFKS